MARVALHLPAADSGVIQAEEEQVDGLLTAGWELFSESGRSGGRRARTGQTGSIPVQQPAGPSFTPQSQR